MSSNCLFSLGTSFLIVYFLKSQIRFGSGKNEAIVDGVFVDEETMTCQTPNFEQQGANTVDIKVNIGGAGWTVNKVQFTYFENTCSKHCLAYGPGLLMDVLYGIEMGFIIQVLSHASPCDPTLHACLKAFDTKGGKRTSGNDNFEVAVVSEDGKFSGSVTIQDNDNGTYDVCYVAFVPGNHLISVKHLDLGENGEWAHIRGSPFKVNCRSPWTQHRVVGQFPATKKELALQSMDGDLVLYGAAESGVHLCEMQGSV